ncbi:PKS-NRPS hybrid synthetase cheA-like [Mercurialis annua]|uniref:PKS-NRPS hybrid synthetase cheA-like n=1 Tax=Mercurialis annua TaxID=3986 RepID=UPI0024AFA618|nr:PKS-NRPS hybrid synthetase cheA-like [Mercurialis annua]
MVVRTSDQRQATSSVIGEYIKSKYTNLKTVYKPADILRDMRDDHGIKMSYSKAYRSKVVAQEMVRGKPYDSFSLIPSYLYMLVVANPGSFVKLEVKDDNSFLYVFMALNASIKGWEFCIPVIAVDGTFLTSAYGGMLLTACAQDGNGKIFPLAFSVVDSENDDSWEWFMRRIRDAFKMRSDMCIVSDRHESIKNAAIAVFSEASHVLCTFHLFNNVKRNFKKSSKPLREAFYGAAKAYTTEAFDYYMKQLDGMCRGLKTYLEAVKYKKWTRAHCENNRHKVMTTNIAESMNSRIKAGKDLPITTLLEYLRKMVQE